MFCPESKSLIHNRKDLNMDKIHQLNLWIGFLPVPLSLYERIDDGAEVDNNGEKSKWLFIDGCSDVLFVFETSGKILLFDHHDGFCQATPDRWRKKQIGIGTPITERPSHITARTDRVYGDSADQEG